jgi:AcrR family transcriptional regulator
VLVALPEARVDYRRRLLAGLAQSLREKGLQGTQISDIVGHARTSRRTFYECFPDKESAFVELIRELRSSVIQLIEAAIDPNAPWEQQVDRAIDAYLGAISEDPALSATVSRALPTLGERGAALQHEGIDRFARLVVGMASGPGMRRDGVAPISHDAAVMLMGGVAELINRARSEGIELAAAGATAKSVIKAVMRPSSG